MAIDRELIYSSLFRIVSDAANFATKSRRLRHWSDVAPAEQPALFMSEKGGVGSKASTAYNAPTKWVLSADIYIYAHSSAPYISPAEILNPLVDAVERALAPDPITGLQTLGLNGMVLATWLSGKVDTDEGVLGDQALAIIPIEIDAI